jgi:hypothetical protein
VEELDVRNDPWDEDQVTRPPTEHLVGDADLAAPGVACLG